jgi:cobalt/nickel transport system permease protein
VAGTSVHLCLAALVGVVLGRAAFPAILVGVALQWALFGHGGLTTLGVNATNMGVGGLVAAGVFHAGRGRPVLRAALAGFLGTLAALALYGTALFLAGRELRAVAWACLALHAPVLVIETVMTALVVGFLLRVQPDLLALPRSAEKAPEPEEVPAP